VVIVSLPTGFAATTTGTVTVTTNGSNTIYTFTGSGTLTPIVGFPVTYLVVAGGGGGAQGGGGAGGLLTGTTTLTTGTTYTITVGAGGAGGSATGNTAASGNNSSFGSIAIATGGGKSNWPDSNGTAGGSGGAGSGSSLYQTFGGAGTTGQGYAGGGNGGNTASPYVSGGGGGAGGVGQDAPSSSTSGNGGVGVASSITGTSVYYAGGGGGGTYFSGTGGSGGNGGGGAGSGSGNGTSGTANTGGGGGGASSLGTSAGSGGSGVVIVSLPSGFAATITGTVTITINGSNTVYTFTGSGTLIPRTGTPNYSNYFNGSSYFTSGNTVTNFLCTSTSTGATATFEAWVYPTAYSTGTYGHNFSSISAKDGTYFNFGVYNGYLRFYWYDGGPKYVQSVNSTDVPLNTWTYVTMTINGSTIKVYINGVLNTTSATYTGIYSAGSGTSDKIGREDNGPTYFTGYISNYRLTNTVVYSSNFTPPTTNLTNITGTQLLTCQSLTLVDNSSNAYSITNSGVTISPFAPF
jgi:hypothetical protein